METSSSESLAADEVVVAVERRNGSSIDARRTSLPTLKAQPRQARSPSVTGPAQNRTPNASPAGRSTRASDLTPSRPTRFSPRVEIRDSQSPPPTVEPAPEPEPDPAPTGHPRPPTPQSSATNRSSQGHQTPSAQTPKRTMGWTVDKIADALTELSEQVSEGHAQLVDFLLEEAEKQAPQPRHLSPVDIFAGMKSIATDSSSALPSGVETMAQHSGEYGKSKGSGRRTVCPVVCIKPDREPVPRYRFHHVEIRKNILAPNSMLNFVPHLRDVDPNSAEEQKYSAWLMDLENLDSKSGFQIQNRSQKLARRARNEYAAALAPYLDRWLQTLAIDGCSKSTLIRYMASQPQNEDAITPQQKHNLLDTHSEVGSPRAVRGARLFTEAFDRVFNDQRNQRRVALRDILMLDKSVEPILDNKRAKDGPGSQKPRDETLMQKTVEALGSYSTLGCLICFGHDCEHGEIERDNQKRCFSLEEIGGLVPTLKRKWAAQVESHPDNPQVNGLPGRPTHPPCRNQCYRSYNTGNPNQDVKPWSESEVSVLESVFTTIGYSPSLRAECFVGAVLGRYCWDVHRKLKELDLCLPPVEPRTEPPRPKAVSWYDRKKKQLLGDWQDATITHEHAVRELFAPCHHEGPCTAANGCPCASAGSHPVLCERFCLCTAEECPLKFTGCACHSSGKTCLQRQKEGRPCICVQLNRECDPVLCKGCGAKERADPENAYDEQLHSTGCQNVALQRGASKAVLVGKSQLEACGYGLFAAEDIAQDEFVIEYTGELISHDEGVRRENRRGDVFDEENKVSYLFTLLEHEGIWVDAAIYGNLSRYMNHASDNCNIMPRIMYVNHEFRIKFSALRDIKAGEELFFNYGDNFPNLTKKLVERNNEKAADDAGQKRKSSTQRPTARKTTSKAKGEGIDFASDGHGDDEDLWLGDAPAVEDDDMGDDWVDHHPRRRKKRGGRRPGAGRKKKQPQPPVSAETGDEASPGSQLRTESGGIASEAAADANMPSRRRLPKQSYSAMLNPHLSFSGSDAGSNTPAELPIKKVSKRGGARPGAGRKPKHRPGQPKPGAKKPVHTSQDSTSSLTTSNDTDEKSTPKKPAASTVSTPKRAEKTSGSTPKKGDSNRSVLGSGAGRKRKAAEAEAEDARLVSGSGSGSGSGTTAAAGLYRHDTFRPIDDRASVSGSRGSRGGSSVRGGGVDDDFDDDDVVDRSARKRQKPWRYRNEEE
ncbi:28bf70b9-bf5e-4983-b740-302282889f69 [Thermothielavioides terrestris]|uniref:28bf70b9-bf5e-4983-b740-302282889f69 n=1 Tax=Thermothielavioides terrestris TaxID=2587410 RepID=A0A446B839_9PEZI|nr:28bf70b9-bf5e-4983-b740-302282889f69 [Thermothielavioides terrestris]